MYVALNISRVLFSSERVIDENFLAAKILQSTVIIHLYTLLYTPCMAYSPAWAPNYCSYNDLY